MVFRPTLPAPEPPVSAAGIARKNLPPWNKLPGGKVPPGTTGNSPPIHRWEWFGRHVTVPSGTKERPGQEDDSTAPGGTRFPTARKPSVETPGYCRSSLRDWKQGQSARICVNRPSLMWPYPITAGFFSAITASKRNSPSARAIPETVLPLLKDAVTQK